MVFDSVAYKSVISNGLVLDKNGNKMSKRLGNAVDPFGAIEKYGSDPLRWYISKLELVGACENFHCVGSDGKLDRTFLGDIVILA